jgi:hypothetical protein
LACVSEGFATFGRWLVEVALQPLLEWLSTSLLSTPNVAQLPRLVTMWTISWELMLSSYLAVVMVAGLVVMGYESVQARYSIREMLPRLLVGFVAGAMSLTLGSMAIDLTNGLSAGLVASSLQGYDAGAGLGEILQTSLSTESGALFLLLIAVVVVISLLVVLLTWVVRVVLVVVLLAAAPMLLMFHALPYTEGIARWWWRTFGACLAIQLVQAFVLATTVEVLLRPGARFGLGEQRTGELEGFLAVLTMLLVVLALCFLLIKIPFWLLSGSRLGGPSIVGSVARNYLRLRSAGVIGGGRSRGGRGGGGRGGGGGGGRGGGRPGGRPQPPDPYERERSTADGQLMLPLQGLRRQSRPTRRNPPASAPPAPSQERPERGRQLALPLAEGWPEDRPVLLAGGQYRLPISVRRVARTPPPQVTPPGDPSPKAKGGPRPKQLALPLDTSPARSTSSASGATQAGSSSWAPGSVAPSTPRTSPASAGSARAGRRSDPYRGVRPLRSGQYPIPLEGLTRRPRPPVAASEPPPETGPRPSPLQRPVQLALPLQLAPQRPPRSTPPPATPATSRRSPTAPPRGAPPSPTAPPAQRRTTRSSSTAQPPPQPSPRRRATRPTPAPANDSGAARGDRGAGGGTRGTTSTSPEAGSPAVTPPGARRRRAPRSETGETS